MRYVLFALIAACAPTTEKPAPTRNPGADFAAMIPEKITGKCTAWTSDSVLCKMSDTTLLWCSAPWNGKPHCEVAADWSPQPPPKADPAAAPAPTTAPKKK